MSLIKPVASSTAMRKLSVQKPCAASPTQKAYFSSIGSSGKCAVAKTSCTSSSNGSFLKEQNLGRGLNRRRLRQSKAYYLQTLQVLQCLSLRSLRHQSRRSSLLVLRCEQGYVRHGERWTAGQDHVAEIHGAFCAFCASWPFLTSVRRRGLEWNSV